MTLAYDRNKSLGHLAGLASRLLSNTLGKRFQEGGIDMTAEQWGAVLVLLNGEAMTQGQLGERLYLEKSSTSRLANRLEQRGWVVRTKTPGDSRQKQVALTSKTLDAVERCTAIARTVLKEAQLGLSDEEQSACRSFLARIIDNLGKDNLGGPAQ